MVGIVVVSHSRALARAAVALAREMMPGQDVRVEAAAGLDETVSGTDAVAIAGAIAAADDATGDGVVVLMDLGSAVLSAGLALDLVDDLAAVPGLGDRVTLCPAPLVEGLVVAVVSAAGGAGRAEVAAEAQAALAGKQAQLAGPGPARPPARPGPAPAGDVVGEFTVLAPHGLHARPAALLVRQVRELDAAVRLRNLTTGAGPVPAASLSRVATLGALAGHRVEVSASGPRARQAVDVVLALAARGFDDLPGAVPEPAGEGAGRVGALGPGTEGGPVPASPGIGVGPARPLRAEPVRVPDEPAGDADREWGRLAAALDAVRADLRRRRERTAAEAGEAEAGIFDAHLLLLDDGALLDAARERLRHEGAAPAWAAAVGAAEASFRELADPYLRARAADVRALGDQVLRALLGPDRERGSGAAAAPRPPGGSGRVVVVAADLTPAQAADLDPARVAALVLAFGSPTAHGAILARARGIPAVVGAGAAVLDVRPGTVLAVDGGRGELVVDPSRQVRDRFAARARRRAERSARALAAAAGPAVTRDGTRVVVAANVGSVADARAAAAAGADGAGLVRTEFLFVDRATAPDVDEQEAAYRAVARALAGGRITLRTLDVGGDKALDYVAVPREANPFLGLRGLRLALARPALLRDQLTAVVRTARATPVSVMFPLVTTVAELERARAVLAAAVAAEGGRWPEGLQVGIMVEVPATALKAAAFAPRVDFLSLGTNDLAQYALAAERGNDAVAWLADALDPGVLGLVRATCAGAAAGAAGTAGPLVGVCGELAADGRAVALLVGLGVRELSVSPPAVPAVKQAVRAVDLGAARALAAAALAADGADAVRALLPPRPVSG